MRHTCLGRDFAERGADLSRDLAFHQLAGDQRDRLPDEILKSTIHRLGDDIGNRHALTFGHRGVLLTSTVGTADEFGAAMADPLKQVDLHDDRHTTSTDATSPNRNS